MPLNKRLESVLVASLPQVIMLTSRRRISRTSSPLSHLVQLKCLNVAFFGKDLNSPSLDPGKDSLRKVVVRDDGPNEALLCSSDLHDSM